MTDYRLQFFSGSESEGVPTDSAGYDGSMTVQYPHLEALREALPELIVRMDCVCGPVQVAVAWEHVYADDGVKVRRATVLHTMYLLERHAA